jgi:hypothetical protein
MNECTNHLYIYTKALRVFKGNSDKYAPQCGGYCAFGVSKEKKFPVEPDAFTVVDGELYLNLNKKVQSRWILNTKELISDADEYWIDIEIRQLQNFNLHECKQEMKFKTGCFGLV